MGLENRENRSKMQGAEHSGKPNTMQRVKYCRAFKATYNGNNGLYQVIYDKLLKDRWKASWNSIKSVKEQ